MPNMNEFPYLTQEAFIYKQPFSAQALTEVTLPYSWKVDADLLFQGVGRHLSGENGYRAVTNFIKSFKFFYAILIEQMSVPNIVIDEGLKSLIKEKIIEGIPHCTEGLHNRINGLYGLFSIPKTMGELLQKVRQDIVDTGAFLHRHDEPNRDRGHDSNTVNYIILRAKHEGFGVEPPNNEDNYGHLFISDPVAIKASYTIFKEKFKPLSILQLLLDEIRNTLVNYFLYQGKLEEKNYDRGEIDSFKSYLNDLFQVEFSDQELLVFDDDYLNIIDINWELIAKHLWFNSKSFFSFSKEIMDAMDYLFKAREFDSDLCFSHLKEVLTRFDSFDDYLILMKLFSTIPSEKKIELLALRELNSQTIILESELIRLVEIYKKDEGYLDFLREKVKTFSMNYLQSFENEFVVNGSTRHPLIAFFNKARSDIAHFPIKFHFLPSQKKLELLSMITERELGVLESVINYDFNSRRDHSVTLSVEKKKQLSAFKSLPSFIGLLQDLTKEQLDVFFSCSNFFYSALNKSRHCIPAFLSLLKKSDLKTLEFCFNREDLTRNNLLYSLLNFNNILTKDDNDLFNPPLNEIQLNSVVEDVLLLLSTLPSDVSQALVQSLVLNNKGLLLRLRGTNITKVQALRLLSFISKDFIFSQIEDRLTLKGYGFDEICGLIEVLDPKNAFFLMSQKIIKDKYSFFSFTPIARKMLFSPIWSDSFNKAYKPLGDSRWKSISNLIFSKESESDFVKWMTLMAKDVDITIFSNVVSHASKKFQEKILKYSITKNKNYGPILLLMKNLNVDKNIKLFEKKSFYGLGTSFSQKIIENESEHQPLLDYLKKVSTIEDKNAILQSIFKENKSAIYEVLSKKTVSYCSIQLLVQMPEEIKIEALIFSLEKLSLSSLNLTYYLDIINNLSEAALAEILLFRPSQSAKHLFQWVVESLPNRFYQLNIFLERFKSKGLLERFIAEGFEGVTPLKEYTSAELGNCYLGFLALLDFLPLEQRNTLLQETAFSIETEEDVMGFIEKLDSTSEDEIKNIFEGLNAERSRNLLESLADKQNHEVIYSKIVDFFKGKENFFDSITTHFFDINKCESLLDMHKDKLKSIFMSSCEFDSSSRGMAISWWKTSNLSGVHKLELLQSVEHFFSIEEKKAWFSFEGIYHKSVLRAYIGSVNATLTDDFLVFLSPLSDQTFYDLILKERYFSPKGSLYHLSRHLMLHDVKSFLTLFSMVLKREDSSLKAVLIDNMTALHSEVFRAALLDESISLELLISFISFCPLNTVYQQLLFVIESPGLDDKLFVLLNRLKENPNYVKTFKNLLISTASNRSLFILDLIGFNPIFTPLFFEFFDSYDEMQKISILNSKLKQSPNLYHYFFDPLLSSLESELNQKKKNILLMITALPESFWVECSSPDKDFIPILKSFNITFSVSKYLFALSEPLFKNLLLSNNFQSEFLALAWSEIKDNQTDRQCFLKKLSGNLSENEQYNLLCFKVDKCLNLSSKILLEKTKAPYDYLLFLSDLSLSHQKHLLQDFIKEHNASVDPNLEKYIHLKLKLIALNLSGFNLIMHTETIKDEKFIKIINALSHSLSDLFKDSLSSQHLSSDAFKVLLTAPETQRVLNQHRGYKKILVNVVAAFAGLGVGYLAGCAVNFYLTDGDHFFFHPPTKTQTVVNDILRHVDDFPADLSL